MNVDIPSVKKSAKINHNNDNNGNYDNKNVDFSTSVSYVDMNSDPN